MRSVRDYLQSINVTPQPVPIAQAAGLEVTVPVPPGQRYLVQLTATNPNDQQTAHSPELTSIIDGFTVVAT